LVAKQCTAFSFLSESKLSRNC